MEADPPMHPYPGEHVEIPQRTQTRKRKRRETQTRKRTQRRENPRLIKKSISDPASANPSIQLIYIHPSLEVASKKYLDTDSGPFVVYVSREVTDPSAGSSIRAIKFGQFLYKNKIKSIVNDGVKSVGRNKMSVEFKCGDAEFKGYIPTFNITRMGLVRGVPVEWHLDEFVESLDLPSGCGEVLKARRLNRKQITEGIVTWVPTQSVVVTFRGQVLPNKIYSYHTSLPVETYYFPSIQCVNCCRFGHTKIQCRSKPRCYKHSIPEILAT
ncbi:jg23693 [Pararge aegeria aegeria]|uniref:Jg23693 protein n=1 Tax=Pararge aegeria aegeria TaxID=348720 RepID=A0A8S4RP38_9NEOP|nr:jg23693 [Pararge aegeria aegeria]